MANKQAAGAAVVILAEEDGIVAVDKPAEVATIPDHAGASASLLGLVATELGVKMSELHPTSRLDRGVSGVVLFARTEAARTRLETARAAGRYRRHMWPLVR